MLFPSKDYVTMLPILLAFLFLTGSISAFQISVPGTVYIDAPVNATWTRSERDQGDFVFALRSISIPGKSKVISDIPRNLSSGTIELNFTYPGVYVAEIQTPSPECLVVEASNTMVVPSAEIGGYPIIPSGSEAPTSQPSASSGLAEGTTTSTLKPPYHALSSTALPTLSSSTAESSSSASIPVDSNSVSSVLVTGSVSSLSSHITTSSSTPISVDSHSLASSVLFTSGFDPVPSPSVRITTSSSSASIFVDGQSTSSSLSPALESVIVPITATATSSPSPSITISGSLNGIGIGHNGLRTKIFSSISSAKLLSAAPTSTLTIATPGTSIGTSGTSDFTSGTPRSATSSQVTGPSSSTTVTSGPSKEVTSNFPSHSFGFEPSSSGATTTVLTNTSSSIYNPQSSSTSSSTYMDEQRLPKVLGGVFAAMSVSLFIIGFVLYRRHQRLKARAHDMETRGNPSRRSEGGLTLTRTLSPQSFNNAHLSSRSSSINSIDEVMRPLNPAGHETTPSSYTGTRTHESHESSALTRQESSDITSEYSYHSLSNPFLDSPEGSPRLELPLFNTAEQESPPVGPPTRSATQKSNGTADTGTSRKTSRPESYFFMFVDGVMQPLDSRSDRYRSLVLSSECSYLVPDQIVLQERADALREDIVQLKRKISSLPSDREQNEELLATIRMREEDVMRMDREIEEEWKKRRSSDILRFSMDDVDMDYSRTSR
ncbi:uncharacterized protein BT62DRAFT_543091 [Guyanagaster necrorhizus]|uniref:Uncharacterized protein n=1 Tax=Guyanagaster necrorhizus TaxID=856835 RepID=A0A9P7W089_9AGAR|nr:uncharacterized protein BT62DRAFT_543091 [Guyanagaster necrorhizus MCA 3950]KAG7450901.1 hypothetical protein BT62DRAFT_543091 [Guyanagaster necrorhizus MCA 3950]